MASLVAVRRLLVAAGCPREVVCPVQPSGQGDGTPVMSDPLHGPTVPAPVDVAAIHTWMFADRAIRTETGAVRPYVSGVVVRHACHMDTPRPTDRDALAAVAIRAVHSVVFWIELVAIGWLVATGLTGRRDRSVGVAAGLVAVEGVVWIANDRVCPLTPLAERFGAGSGSVSDIWLPDVVARTIPYWSIPLVVLGAALHAPWHPTCPPLIAPLPLAPAPEWRNGRRSGLKLRGPQGRPSSNLGSGTNSGIQMASSRSRTMAYTDLQQEDSFDVWDRFTWEVSREVSDAFRVEVHSVDGGPLALGWGGSSTVVIDRPTSGGGRGLGFNGGQLLNLAVAGCISNDLFREASKRGITLHRVTVTVDSDYTGDPAVSTGIEYTIEVSGDAKQPVLDELVDYVDRIAEIPASIRNGTPVARRRISPAV